MKNVIFLSLSLLVAISCTQESGMFEAIQAHQEQSHLTHTVIFDDKTTDKYSSTVQKKLTKRLFKVIQSNFRSEGDKLDIFLISKYTRSESVFKSLTFSNSNIEINYEKQLEELRLLSQSFALKAVNDALKLPTNTAAAEGSDLWGILKRLHDAFDESQTERKQVVIISDLRENMPDTRQFHSPQFLPRSNQQAQEWGIQDAKKVQQVFPELQESKALAGVEILAIIPGEPLTSDESPILMQYYWKALLNEFQIEFKVL